MGILITLRTDETVSYFRRNLLRLVEAPDSNRLLICSGYISEGSYYSVLDDGLLSKISSNCAKVITVAGMFSYSSQEDRYKNFIRKLRDSGVNVDSHRAINRRWHAKVAIKLRDEKPVAGLIGSSNLTGPAYRENYSRFNYEADVLIWGDTPEYDRYFREDLGEFAKSPLDPIVALLDSEFKQSNESDRLKAIYGMIMNEEDLEPFE